MCWVCTFLVALSATSTSGAFVAHQKFDAIMELTHWDEKSFYMTHRFMIGDKLISEGTSKGVFRGRRGVIPPDEVVARVAKYRETGK